MGPTSEKLEGVDGQPVEKTDAGHVQQLEGERITEASQQWAAQPNRRLQQQHAEQGRNLIDLAEGAGDRPQAATDGEAGQQNNQQQ